MIYIYDLIYIDTYICIYIYYIMSYNVDPLMPNRVSSDTEHTVSFVRFPNNLEEFYAAKISSVFPLNVSTRLI